MKNWIILLRFRVNFWLFRRALRRLGKRDPSAARSVLIDTCTLFIQKLTDPEDRAMWMTRLRLIKEEIAE